MPLATELIQLLSPRRGHFQMESGYHSELWFDLDSLFVRPETLRPFVIELALRLSSHAVTAICGPRTGGARLAEMLGAELGLPAHAAERITDPAASGLFPVRYRFSPQAREALRGRPIAIVDDAISAGSAVRGCYADLIDAGARPVVLGSLFVFGEKAEAFAREASVELEWIAHLDFGLWRPTECLQCQAGGVAETISEESVAPKAGRPRS